MRSTNVNALFYDQKVDDGPMIHFDILKCFEYINMFFRRFVMFNRVTAD